jgi:tRNA-dependent cyclodipeptide synthase
MARENYDLPHTWKSQGELEINVLFVRSIQQKVALDSSAECGRRRRSATFGPREEVVLEQAAVGAQNEFTPTARFAGARLFIPISLGNHYYSSEVLTILLSQFIAKSERSVIFLCDRLRFLSYRIRGETDEEGIAANIRLQLDQMKRTLVNLGLNSHPNASVADWSFLRDDPQYVRLVASLEKLVREDRTAREQCDRYVAQFVARFHAAGGPQREDSKELQRQYLIEETALSLYMTEIRGFNVEVYRRGMGFVDDLYSERPVDLMRLLKKSSLDRKFVSIENWLERTKNSRH